jgi:hypothetical protein
MRVSSWKCGSNGQKNVAVPINQATFIMFNFGSVIATGKSNRAITTQRSVATAYRNPQQQ